MRLFVKMLAAALVLIMVVPLSAQVERAEMGSGSLAALLRFVPDTAEARRWLTYGDFRAGEAGRGLPFTPDSYSYFDNQSPELPSQLWTRVTPLGGLSLNYLGAYADLPQILGFDFFDIDRSLVWGQPPYQGTILQGEFDEAAIRAAHESRGFVESDIDGAPLWCAEAGCDTGLQMNVDERELTDIFGGDLGRKFPRALVGDFMIGTGVDTTLERMIEANAGEVNSLADAEDIQALVAALDGDRYIRSAQFASPLDFPEFNPAMILGERATEEMIRELMEQFEESGSRLPLYSAVVFADVADAENESVIVGLAYLDEASATTAGDAIISLINNTNSFVQARPWAEMIAERDGTLRAPEVFYAEAADRYVTLITISKPLPPNEPMEMGFYSQSGMLFQLISRAFLQRDLVWLAPTLGD